MIPLVPVGMVLVGASVAMSLTWWLQRRTRNAGYVDVVWAALMGASALLYGAIGMGAATPRLLVAMLGGIWGFRLSLHLLSRVLHEAEDGRYRHLREHWGGDQRKFFAFFLGQALLVALFSIPFLVVANNPVAGFTWWSLAGVTVWVLSLGGETLADLQLAQWRKNPANRGKTCRAGLWRLLAPPELFLRMAALVRLRAACGRLAECLAGLARTGGLMYVSCCGSPASLHRGTVAALARRGLPPLPAQVRCSSRGFPSGSERHVKRVQALNWNLTAMSRPSISASAAWCPMRSLRLGIRRLCAQRLRDEHAAMPTPPASDSNARGSTNCAAARLRSTPMPPTASTTKCRRAFFELCLGKRLKYSSCYYPTRRRNPGPGGRGDARAVRRARGTGRRPAHPGTGLRLGFADPVDGRALSERAHHRRCPTPRAARAHRARCRERGLATSTSSPATSTG
jgi:steroid 5-alpha reductase family enzyme